MISDRPLGCLFGLATGVIYGQLAGACHGYAGISESWREKIAKAGLIRELAGRIADRPLD